MLVQEPINGYIVECERLIRDELGNESTEQLFYKVNAPSNQAAYKFVQEQIANFEGMSIKGVIVEYPLSPFTGIIN